MTTLTTDSARAPFHGEDGRGFAPHESSTTDLDADVRAILNRRPAVGLTIAVVRKDRPTVFITHGVADVASNKPVSGDTVFRIGSITKLFTAIAVMQFWEQDLVDLDAPANDYLRAYKLIPTDSGWRPATLRHLLTHTAGVPDARGIGDLRHGSVTASGGRPPQLSVDAGQPMPTLAQYYRPGLRVVAEPGTSFAYTNHGFATLGQIVEDVSGAPLADVLRERIFRALGMADTDLLRSERLRRRLATGYVMTRTGPRPVADRDWIGGGASSVYSTAFDMALFIDALLAGGGNEHGRILEPSTLALMFEPHYQPDPRVPGLGLGFFRSEAGGHRLAGHDGILPGFNSELLVAPDDGIGVIAMTNGSSGAFSWLQVELDDLLRELLGVPDVQLRHDLPHNPQTWADLCGRYVLAAGAADLRQRVMFGGGAEVFVRSGRLMARLLTPIPALYRGLPLEPGDDQDPDVFRLDLSPFGMAPIRVVFSRSGGGQVDAAHTDLGGQPWSLLRRPAGARQRRWLKPVLAAGIAACLLIIRFRRPRLRGVSK